MSKITIIILFSLFFYCTGFERDQASDSDTEFINQSESDEGSDKFEVESRQDFDKTSEKEKEIKLIRKAKRLKETNYRRALESILPAKNSEGYRKFFEELINNSQEKSRLSSSKKELEDVVVTDSFSDGDTNDDNHGDPQVEEIEVVIEHITDDDNSTDTNDKVPEEKEDNLSKVDLREKFSAQVPIENKNQEPPANNTNTNETIKERTGQDTSRSAEMDAFPLGHFEERRLLEPYSLNRYSEVVIPHYRTTLTRGGVVVSPAVYTVQTSAPIVDHVTTRAWIPKRGMVPDIFGRATNNKIGRSETNAKLIDDYNDYGSNAYSYAPSKLLSSARQTESKMDMLTKLAENSNQPQLGNFRPFRENIYPTAYYPQAQRYYPDSYRTLFRIRR